MALNLLEGIRVLELAILIPGDQTGELLADLGADVIKIEPPPHGDYLREMWAVDQSQDRGSMHLMLNRNKRSITLDLKKKEGLDIFMKLLETADVVVDLSLPGTREKLGVGYEDCKKVKPDIIYAAVTAFGHTGPLVRVPSHGISYGAFTGGNSPVDLGHDRLGVGRGEGGGGGEGSVPPFAVIGICAALVRRARTGEGMFVETAVVDTVTYTRHQAVFEHFNPSLPVDHPRTGSGAARVNNYYTKDHEVLMIASPEEKFWKRFCAVINDPDLAQRRGNWAHGDTMDYGVDPELEAELRQIFLTKTRKEWLELLLPEEVPVVPSLTFEGMLDYEDLVDGRGLVTTYYDHHLKKDVTLAQFPIRAGGQATSVRYPAPNPGEHNKEILAEVGIGGDQMEALYANGVLFTGRDHGSRPLS